MEGVVYEGLVKFPARRGFSLPAGCWTAGVAFVGPDPKLIRSLGPANRRAAYSRKRTTPELARWRDAACAASV